MRDRSHGAFSRAVDQSITLSALLLAPSPTTEITLSAMRTWQSVISRPLASIVATSSAFLSRGLP